jgi:hypothetical protein
MVSEFSVMLVAFVKCMFHNNLIDGPTVQPLHVKSKKQTFCECDGPGKRRFVSFDLGGHAANTPYHSQLAANFKCSNHPTFLLEGLSLQLDARPIY